LGAIVRNGPSNEFGILAIAPSRGKIVFWENVDSAEVRSQFAQRPQGVQGSVKMYSGEVVKELVEIDHAGYVLVFSSGRMAQLTLRDSQGRPSIATNVLNSPNGSGGSFFSFKGLLGGALQKSIAAVKAHTSDARGQMEVITVTKTGLFRVWDLSWSGQQMYKGEVDLHDTVLAAIQGGAAVDDLDAHVLDFAILEEQNLSGTVSMLVLVALSGPSSVRYSLLEVDLSNAAGVVRRAIPIENFHQQPVHNEPTGVLLLPSPGHTAFIQFPGAVVVASLAKPEESPDTQLLVDSGKATVPFQDTIYLRNDRPLHFYGSAVDNTQKKDKHASVVFFIQGYGIIHIAAHPQSDEDDIDRQKVTVKSKLEQATFFSTDPDNILDFSVQPANSFSLEEVEKAAIEISSGILSSSYEYVDKVISSMEQQMQQRALALSTLASYLQTEYPPLSWPTRWHLLWNAEKLHAALELWKTYQATVEDQRARPEAYPESLLLPHMVKCLHERFKTQIRPELGETDPVRQFFTKDINSFEILLPWAWLTLRTFYINADAKKDRASVMQRLSEANDVMITVLEAAYKFREENLENYGIDPSTFCDGLLRPEADQDLLPQFWTSTHNLVSSVRSLVDVGRNLASTMFEEGVQEDIAMKVASDNPRLVRLGCQMHLERFTWALSQTDDEKMRDMGQHLRMEWNSKVRPDHIYGLADIGLAMEGMKLAEEYNDMATLAHLVWDEKEYLEESKQTSHSKMEQAECVVKLNKLKERIHRYFEKWGDKWASAFYTRHITQGRTELLFHKDYMNQHALTRFLRAGRTLGKLAWINEVSGEKNYEHAHDALIMYATAKEENAWCKKVELSIAKLSLLCKHQEGAAVNEMPLGEAKEKARLAQADARLDYMKIQDRLYDRLAAIQETAVDHQATLQLLMEVFGQGRLKERPAHQQLLRQGFDELIRHRVLQPALLIDVLTLMSYDEARDPMDIIHGNEFAFALEVLGLSWPELNKTTRINLRRLIWKRLCIRDDWASINNTKDVSDEELQGLLADTTLGRTFKTLFHMTGKFDQHDLMSTADISHTEENPLMKVVWPREIETFLGAGCTNGELCTRFADEDLRTPIIVDNVADDVILRDNIEKHRLESWFPSALSAARKAYTADLQQEQEQEQDTEDEGAQEGGAEENSQEDADADVVPSVEDNEGVEQRQGGEMTYAQAAASAVIPSIEQGARDTEMLFS
jgi:nuclear pore complex protein Nup133